jgi:hypothetical protein
MDANPQEHYHRRLRRAMDELLGFDDRLMVEQGLFSNQPGPDDYDDDAGPEEDEDWVEEDWDDEEVLDDLEDDDWDDDDWDDEDWDEDDDDDDTEEW